MSNLTMLRRFIPSSYAPWLDPFLLKRNETAMSSVKRCSGHFKPQLLGIAISLRDLLFAHRFGQFGRLSSRSCTLQIL